MSSPTPAARPGLRTTAAAGLLLAAAVLLGGCSSSSGEQAPASPAASDASPVADVYGTLPTFLPMATTRPDATLTGTAADPALTVEGDAVRAVLGDGAAVTVTVSGPVVPGEGLPHATPAPTCTWTVSVSGATRPVRLSVADFHTSDHLGATYAVALVPGRPRPPRVLRPGGRTTFELRAVMPAGEGLMHWAPHTHGQARSGLEVAAWDFEVEND